MSKQTSILVRVITKNDDDTFNIPPFTIMSSVGMVGGGECDVDLTEIWDDLADIRAKIKSLEGLSWETFNN